MERLTERAAARQHASDVAGIGKAFDRGADHLDYHPAGTRGEGGGIIDKGGGNFISEGLHFECLRVK